MKRIEQIEDKSVRFALSTIFSDSLRYQNMLCRYDTWALKCQDIFSVHGFPVGLIQCENNLLGISRIGSGGFRHFIEKFYRAKQYCQKPFEIRKTNGRKQLIHIPGERRAIHRDQRLVAGFAAGMKMRQAPKQGPARPRLPRDENGAAKDPTALGGAQVPGVHAPADGTAFGPAGRIQAVVVCRRSRLGVLGQAEVA